MANKTLNTNHALYQYILSISLRDSSVQQNLRNENADTEMGIMQISPDQAQFIALLIKLIQAEKIIEVGTFTGYSTLVMANALPDHGKIIACDINKAWTDIALHHWQQANVDHKIDLYLAPAADTLDKLINDGNANQFDVIFIDADKINYLNYYERGLTLVKPGGLICVDNVLWGGNVIDNADQSDDTVAIRDFNAFLHTDDRVDISLVPIGDGLSLARKK
ncbi:MAG: methyltransferase domain-containing protein [Gammaproteobacteria bacterium]|nr:methyltransferase domain-containing protein [Gammaproteobacteria bacterium]